MSDLRYTGIGEFEDGLRELRGMVSPDDGGRLRDVVYALVEFATRDNAHELAEKIRTKCHERYGSPNALRPGRWADEGCGLLDAADLIDPEATS